MDCAGDAPLSQFDREVSNSTMGEAWNMCNSHLMNTIVKITAKLSSRMHILPYISVVANITNTNVTQCILILFMESLQRSESCDR